MSKRLFGLLALSAAALWAATAASQGPPRGWKKGPPRFELGEVLPPFARDAIELTAEQEQEIARLEQEVKRRLEKILTAGQKTRLRGLHPPPPGGPPPDGPGGPPRREPPGKKEGAKAAGGIQWFATWESGLAEARRSGRPILLVSAAPHCAGVPGIW